MAACKYGDKTCPCQDGDSCHYEGNKPMASTTYFYCCIDLDRETRHQHQIAGSWSFADYWHMQKLAQHAADDYHSNHDGWESHWPLVFALYGSDRGLEQARFSVEMEARAHFTARRVEPCRDDGRCQYAIDHGAEGLGHCPAGKCCMPATLKRAEDLTPNDLGLSHWPC